MGSELIATRVRREVEDLARGGLDIATFCAEFDDSLRKAVPSCASCAATLDPASHLLTGGFKFGEIAGNDEHDEAWGLGEYQNSEPTSFIELATAEVPAAGVHVSTQGDVKRSPRMRDVILPHLECADELRLVARVDGRVWGGMAWFGEVPFGTGEVALVASISEAFAIGLRAGILARLVSLDPPSGDTGPAVIVVDSDDQVSQLSAGAEKRLEELGANSRHSTPMAIIGALVSGARRFAGDHTNTLPRNRVQLPTGQWLLLHASPLSDADGATGNVVVTIEEARPPEIMPLLVAAFDLTPREREVIQLVLRGFDTKEIAATLRLSAYTVQDHLKAVFEKADVSSRRELVNQVFLGQYAPRLGAELAPSGWFLNE